jgi:uncharacterized protein
MDEIRPPEENADARSWAVFCHLSPLIGILLSVGLLNFVGPLVIWLVKREQYPYVDDQGKEALNFQLTLLILSLICLVVTLVSCGALFPILFLPLILQVVFAIISSMAANKGEYYRYPYNIRIVK